MKMSNRVFRGTEIKINISVEPIGSATMDDYDFEAEFFCSPVRSQVIKKEEARRIDKDNYVMIVDSNQVGVGALKCRMTAYIPDGDFDLDFVRKEVTVIDTGVTITSGV